MYRSIRFTSNVKFLGRNGMFVSKGMLMLVTDGESQIVSIAPITTKETEGRCWIEFPVADIPVIIAILQELSDEIKRDGGAENATRSDD